MDEHEFAVRAYAVLMGGVATSAFSPRESANILAFLQGAPISVRTDGTRFLGEALREVS